MARHLIIGDGTSYGVTSGLVDDGAVSIQKLSSSGPTELIIGETIADSEQIRIIGGGSDGKDIVTPWIYGRDVINYSGKSYSAAAAQTSTILPVTTSAAAAKEIEIKFVNLSSPEREMFKYSVTIAASSAIATSGGAINDGFNALTNVPDWLNPTSSLSTATVTFTGAKRGDTAQSGNTWDYEPVVFKTIVSINPTTTQTYTVADNVIDATPGYGDGFAVKAFENAVMGTSHGYYNRLELPNAPTNQAVTGTTYDMYSIVATKDGSSSSQINGVDNLIEINIALPAGDADNVVFENKLNGYLASAGFTPVIL